MSRPLPLALALGGFALAGLVACPTRTPVGPPPVHVPPGCERNQAGEYHHVGNPAFRYLAQDDGRTLSLTLLRSRADGGVGGTPDAGAITISVARTPEGFVGETHATGFSAGTPCPVKFPTEVTACAPETLTLRSVEKTSLDEACRPAPSGPPPAWTEQVLRRGPPPEPSQGSADGGAGSPDAGTRPHDGGVTSPDAGTRPQDGGVPSPDAGPRAQDGGTPSPDAGPRPQDGGVSSRDAGTAAPDAGPTDGGAIKPPGGPAPRKP
jgi:hypothetical protein